MVLKIIEYLLLYRMGNIRNLLKERILILDGAMGTMIQQHPLTEEDFRNITFKNHPKPLKGNNDLLSITQPNLIEEIHTLFLEVGADIIETNTFSSTSIAQADYGLENMVEKLNFQSAKIARKIADQFTKKTPKKPRFVAGSIGPTNRTASISPDVNDPGYRAVTFDQLRVAYKEQCQALIAGGVDILLVETVFDTLNAKAALFAIEEVKKELSMDFPVMVSGTITDASGRTLSGQMLEAFIISVSHVELLSIGLNCALGADQLKPYLKILAEKSNNYVSAHPNAGLPNEFGQYDETPEQTSNHIKDYLDESIINIVGGCCGTTPQHIGAIAKLSANYTPRKIPEVICQF